MLWILLFVSLVAHVNGENQASWQTSQSSDYRAGSVKYSSERAIDKNQTKCAHTLEEKNPWWSVDLMAVYNIRAVRIFNVNQQNIDMVDARIYIGNSLKNIRTTKNLCIRITNFIPGQWNEFECEKNLSGRYINVSLPKMKHLVLCEVEICGSIIESPFQLFKQNLSWEDALNHCRENGMHLASIPDEKSQALAELKAQEADTRFVWLGLRYSCALGCWFWVDDEPSDFSCWAPEDTTMECSMGAAMQKDQEHLWFSKSDTDKLNFLCV